MLTSTLKNRDAPDGLGDPKENALNDMMGREGEKKKHSQHAALDSPTRRVAGHEKKKSFRILFRRLITLTSPTEHLGGKGEERRGGRRG